MRTLTGCRSTIADENDSIFDGHGSVIDGDGGSQIWENDDLANNVGDLNTLPENGNNLSPYNTYVSP